MAALVVIVLPLVITHGSIDMRADDFPVNDFATGGRILQADGSLWPLHAAGKSCDVRKLDGWPVGGVRGSRDGRSKTLAECQQKASHTNFNYFQVREQSKLLCRRFYTCNEVQKSGYTIYYANTDAKVGKSCSGRALRGDTIEVDTPAECERLAQAPARRRAYHVLQHKPSLYMDCWTLSECDPATRKASPSWRIFRKPQHLWSLSECDQLDGAISAPLVAESDPEGLCQERAIKSGHKFFAYSRRGRSCKTSKTCKKKGTGTALAVREEPSDPPTGITCSAEADIRKELEDRIFGGSLGGWRKLGRMPLPTEEGGWGIHDNWIRPLATAVRSVFHDAQDYNRLMLKSNRTKRWQRIDATNSGEYGGVDGCIYEPAARANCGDWCMRNTPGLLNWNLQKKRLNDNPLAIDRSHFHYAVEACRNLCCSSSSTLGHQDKAALCGPSMCDPMAHISYEDRCIVDMTVFGVLVIIEKVSGPQIPMVWGRRQRDCNNIFKHTTVPAELDNSRTALSAASLGSFHNTSALVHDFELLGFDPKEMTALMGAHSFGKVHKYSGDGLVVRNQGTTFCSNPNKLLPPLSVADMDNVSTGDYRGQCKPEESAKRNGRPCWHKSGARLEPSRLGLSAEGEEPDSKWQDPKFPSFSWGGFWDTTPDKLDNEYFKVLNASDVGEKKICCGLKSKYGCNTFGTTMQNWDGKHVSGQGCETSWCMRSMGSGGLANGPPKSEGKANWIMHSTRQHVSVHGRSHRLYSLAADWALLENPEAHAEVIKFAKDEGAFHAAFSKAFSKLLQNGWPKTGEGALRTCVPETTTVTTTAKITTTTTRFACQKGGEQCQPNDRSGASMCTGDNLSLQPGQQNSDTFRCLGGWCIPLSGLCNGVPNCGDHSDESSCCDGAVEQCADSSTTQTQTPTSTTTSTTTVRLAGNAISSGDTIFLKALSTGKHIDVEGTAVQARWTSHGTWQAITIHTKSSGTVTSGDVVYLKAHTGAYIDVLDGVVKARWEDMGDWQAMIIHKKIGSGVILHDDILCLKARAGHYIEVEAGAVQARWNECGDWQSLRIEREVAGALFSGDSIHLLAHTGARVDVEVDFANARWDDKGTWQTFTIQNHGGRAIYSGDAVFLTAHTQAVLHVEDTAVLAKWTEYGAWQTFFLQRKNGTGPLMHGDTIFLRAHTGRFIEIEGIAVQARWFEKGDWQSLTVEKSALRPTTTTTTTLTTGTCYEWLPQCQPNDGSRPSMCTGDNLSLQPGQTNRDTFRCLGGWCIPLSGLCNGIPNCADRSDESGCCDNAVEKCQARAGMLPSMRRLNDEASFIVL